LEKISAEDHKVLDQMKEARRKLDEEKKDL